MQGASRFVQGFVEGAAQLGYDPLIASPHGSHPTGFGVPIGAESGELFDAPTSSYQATGRIAGSIGSAIGLGIKGQRASSSKLVH